MFINLVQNWDQETLGLMGSFNLFSVRKRRYIVFKATYYLRSILILNKIKTLYKKVHDYIIMACQGWNQNIKILKLSEGLFLYEANERKVLKISEKFQVFMCNFSFSFSASISSHSAHGFDFCLHIFRNPEHLKFKLKSSDSTPLNSSWMLDSTKQKCYTLC